MYPEYKLLLDVYLLRIKLRNLLFHFYLPIVPWEAMLKFNSNSAKRLLLVLATSQGMVALGANRGGRPVEKRKHCHGRADKNRTGRAVPVPVPDLVLKDSNTARAVLGCQGRRPSNPYASRSTRMQGQGSGHIDTRRQIRPPSMARDRLPRRNALAARCLLALGATRAKLLTMPTQVAPSQAERL